MLAFLFQWHPLLFCPRSSAGLQNTKLFNITRALVMERIDFENKTKQNKNQLLSLVKIKIVFLYYLLFKSYQFPHVRRVTRQEEALLPEAHCRDRLTTESPA